MQLDLQIGQVRRQQLSFVSLTNLIELDTIESNDRLTARTSIGSFVTKLHGELGCRGKLKLVLSPYLGLQACSFLILEHILTTCNLCQIFSYRRSIRIDVNSPIFQTILGTRQLHDLLVDSTVSPTCAKIDKTSTAIELSRTFRY